MPSVNNKPIVTGLVRISYEHLREPYANQQGAEPKYSATLLLPKSDVATKAAMDAAIRQAIEEGVKGKWNGARPAQPPIPIHDGDGVRDNGEAFGPECRGCWVMTASSKQRPEVVDASCNPIMDATAIYSGMYARVSIRFFAYNAAGKKGIGCGLGNVQKIQEGESLGGRTSAADDFGGAEPEVSAPAPSGAYPAAAPQYPIYTPQAPAAPQYTQPAAPDMPQGYPQAAAPGYPAPGYASQQPYAYGGQPYNPQSYPQG